MALILNGGIAGSGLTDAAYADFAVPASIVLPFTMSYAIKQGPVMGSHAGMAITDKEDVTGNTNYTIWNRLNRSSGIILENSHAHQVAATVQIVGANDGPAAAITNMVGNGATVVITTDITHFFVVGDWVQVTCLSSYNNMNGDVWQVTDVTPTTITVSASTTGTYVPNAGDKLMYGIWQQGDVWNLMVLTCRDVNTAPTRQLFIGVVGESVFRRKTDGTNASGAPALASILAQANRISFGAVLKEASITQPVQGVIAQAAIWSNFLATEAQAEELLIKPPANVSWDAPVSHWTFINNGIDSIGGNTAVLHGSATFDSSAPTYPSTNVPTVSGVSAGFFSTGTSVVITGTNFGAIQGSGQVVISPTNNVNNLDRVVQTVTAWTDLEVTFTAVRGDLPYNSPCYLFVINGGANANVTGQAIEFNRLIKIQEVLVNLAGAPVVNETGITAFVWLEALSSLNTTPDEVLTNLSTNGQGETDWPIEGLSLIVDDPIWVALFKDGTPYRATLRKIVPTYE